MLLALSLTQGGCSDSNEAGQPARAEGSALAASLLRSGAGLPPARAARYVKLVEVTEWNGKEWATIAEFNLIDATGATVNRKGWVASADSAEANDAPGNAIDGNPGSLWHSRWQGNAPPPPHEFIVKLEAPVRISGFRYLPRQDNLVNGTIGRYRFYLSNDGVEWGEPVALGDFTEKGAPKEEKTVIFAEQTENHAPVLATLPAQTTPVGESVNLALRATDSDGDPITYSATGLPAGVIITSASGLIAGTPISTGESTVTVTAADNKGLKATASFQWNVQPPVAASAAAKPAAGEVRFVRLEEVSEINGKPWASIAEFNLIDAKGANLPRTGWTASADSADLSDKASNAVDGDPATVWHSQWDGASPPPPHSLIIDMRRFAKVSGFKVLPRQDKLSNGIIARFRFYTSVDGLNWGQPVAEGDFSTLGTTNAEKTVWLR